MAKVVKKIKDTAQETKVVAQLPTRVDEIFKLKIDRETQDFYIDGLDSYGHFSELTIRPLDTLNKIVAYTEDYEIKAESNLYRELKQAVDTWGAAATDKDVGKVCGRVVWKNLMKGWTEDQIEENKAKAKFYTLVFGIATIPGKEPVLVDFRVGGKGFMDISNLLKKIKDEKHDYHNAEITLTATHNEDFDWPNLEFTIASSRTLPVAGLEPLFDTVNAYVEDHNEKIAEKAEKYLAWKASKSTSFKRK